MPEKSSPLSWWLSTALFFLFGSLGALFAGKEFADPAFSQWVSPGPGKFLLGDSGRLQELDNAIQSLLVGAAVNKFEGVMLALGTVGVLLSPFSSNLCQFLTCTLTPLQAWYFLVNIVYLPLTGATEGAVIGLIVGVVLQGLCLWRLSNGLMERAPTSSKLILNLYMVFGFFAMTVAGLMVYRAPEFKDEIAFLAHVREYFLQVNGMAWTEGNDAPDGFKEYLEALVAKVGIDTTE
jgi:hypothetical protein